MDLGEREADADKIHIKLHAFALDTYQFLRLKIDSTASIIFLFKAAGPFGGQGWEHSESKAKTTKAALKASRSARLEYLCFKHSRTYFLTNSL